MPGPPMYARKHTNHAIPDSEILDWIIHGDLVIRHDREVWKWHHRRNRFERILVRPHDSDRRNACNLRAGTTPSDRQRTIYLNKLVWFWHTRQLVPADHVIDHINTDPTDDHFSNLRLMTYADSDRQGWRAMTATPDDFDF